MRKPRIRTAALVLAVVTCGAAPGRPAGWTEGRVEADGATLFTKTMGAGDPIVVLHGGPGFDHRQFLPFIEELAAHHQVILYDQRGTGLSSGPVDAASITIDRFVEDVEAIRKAFGPEKMNLLGHSWGGVLAQYYALRYPDRLGSLILCSTTPTAAGFDALRATVARNRSPEDAKALEEIEATPEFQREDPEAVARFWRVYFRAYFPDPDQASKMDLIFTENTLKNSNTVARLIFSSIGRFDLRDGLRGIDVPTLILHGDSDPLPLEYAQSLHDSLPSSRLVVLRHSGHWIFVDATAQFRDAIERFLDRVARDSPSASGRQGVAP